MSNMLRTNFHNEVVTPIPSDIDPKFVIGVLHDHGFLITLSPIVTGHEIKERNLETGWIIYTVHEIVNVLPFGLWQKPTTFQVHFKDKEDGTISFIEAGAGVKSEANYTVRRSGEGQASLWIIDEQIESSCSIFLKWIVQSNMLPVRTKMHQQILEKLRERLQDGTQPASNTNHS